MLMWLLTTDRQSKFNQWMNWNNNWQQRKESPWFPSHFGGMEQNQGTFTLPPTPSLPNPSFFFHTKIKFPFTVWLQQFERWDQMWWMIPWCCWWVGDSQSPKRFLLISSTNTFLTLKALENPPLPPSSLAQRLIQLTGSILPSPSLSSLTFLPSWLFDLMNRWMLEKYDGVRAFWNPQSRCFYSRKGLKKNLPQDIIDSMPNIFLDGELWYFALPLFS